MINRRSFNLWGIESIINLLKRVLKILHFSQQIPVVIYAKPILYLISFTVVQSLLKLIIAVD